MSEQSVKDIILEPMHRLFLPPRKMEQADEIVAMRQYTDALKGFSDAVLKGAWVAVRDKHTKAGWPPVGAFVVEAKRQAGGGMSGAQQRRSRAHAEAERRWSLWLSIRSSDLARRAAREGWAYALKMEVLEHGKSTEQIMVTEILAAGATAAREIIKLRTLAAPSDMQQYLIRCADRREESERETAREIEMEIAIREEARAGRRSYGEPIDDGAYRPGAE